MSSILDSGKSPEQWADIFAARGFKISARQMRSDARELNACIIYGKAMILLPEHVDRILQKKSKGGTKSLSADSKDASMSFHLVDTTEKALAHLERCRNRRRS